MVREGGWAGYCSISAETSDLSSLRDGNLFSPSELSYTGCEDRLFSFLISLYFMRLPKCLTVFLEMQDN